MSGFCFTGQQLNNSLVESISSLLGAADIANLLWGNYLLTIYGVPTIVDGVAFVVPDKLIEKAFATLSKAGFSLCTRTSDCIFSNAPWSPSPARHLHITDQLSISLFQKSDVLQEFPDLELLSQNNSLEIMRASDVRLPSAILGRGQGRFTLELSPVRILSPLKYCEAVIFLLCRDYGTRRQYHWMSILNYIMEYVEDCDIFNEGELREEYQPFYQAVKDGDSRMFMLLKSLRHGLVERGLFPVSQD